MNEQEESYKWFIRQDIESLQYIEDAKKQFLLIGKIIKDLTHIADDELIHNILLFQNEQDSIQKQVQTLQQQMNELLQKENENFKNMYENVLKKI